MTVKNIIVRIADEADISETRVVEKGNLEIVNVYKANTDSEEIQEGEFVIFETFYELSDGTWSTEIFKSE